LTAAAAAAAAGSNYTPNVSVRPRADDDRMFRTSETVGTLPRMDLALNIDAQPKGARRSAYLCQSSRREIDLQTVVDIGEQLACTCPSENCAPVQPAVNLVASPRTTLTR